MEKDIHNFLNSNLLNKYLVGDTSVVETAEVEFFISNYPEVEAAYMQLQDNLEIMASVDAVDAPSHVLDNVLNSLETSNEPKVIHMTQKRRSPWFSIAASAAAILFAASSYMLYEKNQQLNDENNVVVEEIFDLRNDIENNNSKLDELSMELTKLNNPDAKKYVIRGNDRAKDLKTVAYINPVDKTSMVDVITLPQLPEEQYYQMWADIQGKMVNLGILDEADRKLRPIPYMEDASALSITIETKGMKEKNNNTEVAEVSLKDEK
ncbi:anti-sigma factor [Winogradskyella ursingii]|uniref:anti-sigma factor n=1 Tax=Winogradskyella ursingii TaxID=2686079 RepID=UPI0015C7444C|nr:anti-sigma factor [Winogradskyella ursingii]